MDPTTDLILLLPGWGTPPARMEPLADVLVGAGAIAHVWSYEPAGAFDALTDRFAADARAVRAQHGHPQRLHLVGHSLGGVVAAAAALRPLAGTVTSVTTINSPWRGTWVSYTGSGPLARALRWGSPVLTLLREELADNLTQASGPRWLLVSAAGDLATPATTSLTGAPASDRMQRRVIAAAGHSTSLASERLIDAVASFVFPSSPATRWRGDPESQTGT